MKKLLLSVALLAATAGAHAQLAYPGSSWATIMTPAGVAGSEEHNTLLQGRAEQGIIWHRFGGWAVNTYGSISYSVDTDGLGYNNKVVPAIGLKLVRTTAHGSMEVGVQAIHEQRWKDGSSGSGVQLFGSYWTGWDLRKK